MRVPARSLLAAGRCTGEGGVSLALLRGQERQSREHTLESPTHTLSAQEPSSWKATGKVRTGSVQSRLQPRREPTLLPHLPASSSFQGGRSSWMLSSWPTDCPSPGQQPLDRLLPVLPCGLPLPPTPTATTRSVGRR